MANRWFCRGSRLRLVTPLALLLLWPGGAGAVSYGDLSVTADPEPKGIPSHGYTEYRLTVQNRSSAVAHQVTLSLPAINHSGYGGRFDHIRSISRTVEVGPGQAVSVSLLSPDRPGLSGQGVRVTIDGRRQEDNVPLNVSNSSGSSGGRGPYMSFRGYGFGGGGTAEPLILLSQSVERFAVPMRAGGPPPGGPGMGAPAVPPGGGPGLPKPKLPAPPPAPPPGGGAAPPAPGDPLPGAPGAGPFGPGGAAPGMGGFPVVRGQLMRSDFPVIRWSKSWLGYSRYDGVVVTAKDLADLRLSGAEGQAVRTALWQYVETGGVLVVLGPGEPSLPASWARRRAPQGLTEYHAGFGRCLVSADRDPSKWDETHWQLLDQAWSQTASPWQQAGRSLTELNNTFPVVDDIGVPVRGLFVLMIAFSVALGPVNLTVLGRKKKRIWMLWTVPLISFVTCVLVFGYMIVSEGWQGRARLTALTILDENERRATTLGRMAFYTPLTPGDGLHFKPDTEVTAMGVIGGEGGGSACTVDWTNDQHLARGWVSARVPAHFALRKSEVARQRVTIGRSADGNLTAVNGLGADVKKLLYADEKGQVYSAGPIAAGQQATLKPEDKGLPAEALTPREKVFKEGNWANALALVTQSPRGLLVRRSYVAQIDSVPFFEGEGLRGARVYAASSLVLGILREGDDAR
jgi:hypothetical protein